jgi:MYXO-CTERM domain-containing protein
MSRVRLISLFILVCVSPLARALDWSEFGSDAHRSRHTPEGSGTMFVPSWTYALGSGSIVATPLTAGGKIIVAGSNGTVAALNAADGALIWSRALPEGVRATPLVSNDLVAISTLGGELYSLALSDGAIAWRRAFGGQNYSSPLLIPRASAEGRDTLVLGAGFPRRDVWRLDVRTGEPVWTTASGDVAGLIYSSPALAGDRVVIGMNGGGFQAFDLATGTTRWKLETGGEVYLSSPLVVEDRVYAFPGDGGARLYAADAATGAPVSGFPVAIPDPAPVAGAERLGTGPAISSPVSVDGLIVVQLRRDEMLHPGPVPSEISMREYVAAIDPVSAQVRWQYLVSTRVAGSTNGVPELLACPTPAAYAGPGGSYLVVTSSIQGRVAVLEARTGQERWTTPLSSPGRSSPVLSNGQLLVATDDGVVHAFASTSNRPPAPPSELAPSGDVPFAAGGVRIEWHGAADPDGNPLSYIVRLEREGQPESRSETETAAGEAELDAMLEPDARYLFAVRSRDASGALSAWSETKSLHVVAAAPGSTVGSADSAPAPAPSETTAVTMNAPPPPLCVTSVIDESAASNGAGQGGCAMGGGPASTSASLVLLGLVALAARRRADRDPPRRR